MKIRSLILLTLAALLISACSYNFTTVIASDGSGEFIIEMAITAADIELIEEEQDQDFEDMAFDETGEDNLEDACFAIEDELDFRGSDAEFKSRAGGYSCRVIVPFDDLYELIAIYEEIGLADDLRIRMNSDGDLDYRLDLDMFGIEEDPEFAVFDEFEMQWKLTLPGRVTGHNADQRRGRTLSWDMLTGDDILRIDAESVPTAFNWLLYGGIGLFCLCAFALVAAGAGFFFYNKSRQAAASAE